MNAVSEKTFNKFKEYFFSISKDSEYTFKSPRKQYFPLPSDIISHMLNKPTSPDGLQKLYLTCKYFFAKRPILILCKRSYITEYGISANFFQFQKRIKLNNNGKTLFWFTYSLHVCRPFSTDLKTIFLNSSRILEIHSTTMNFPDFILLISDASKIKEFCFIYSTVEYSDGSNVPINVIFSKLTNVDRMCFMNPKEKFSKETLEKLCEIQFSNTFNSFHLHIVSVLPCFDATLLCKFLKNNLQPNSISYSFARIYVKCENKQIIKESIDKSIKDMSKYGENFNVSAYEY